MRFAVALGNDPYVIAGLIVRGDAVVLINGAFTRVRTRKRQLNVSFKSFQQAPQVLCSCFNVLDWIVSILTTKTLRGRPHPLHHAPRALIRASRNFVPQALPAGMRASRTAVLRSLPDPRVNKSRIDPLTLAHVVDEPVRLRVPGSGYVSRNGSNLRRTGDGHGCHHTTE